MPSETPNTHSQVDKAVQRAQLIGLSAEMARISRVYFNDADTSNSPRLGQAQRGTSNTSVCGTSVLRGKISARKNIDRALFVVGQAASNVRDLVKLAELENEAEMNKAKAEV
ncbi:hypothetical protein GQ607_016676 [Colletotrichum asianum]|uniref:Uncharacterized protein n=1 Tax=Colletotrichum asianum TaxID=702518 RepID=A0A8H3W0K8_9PEZI|nr:hypothetical protein GQ607_016676 [Colletotrichum asianum]